MNQGQINNYKHGPPLEQLPVGDEAVIVQVINPDIIQVLFKIYFYLQFQIPVTTCREYQMELNAITFIDKKCTGLTREIGNIRQKQYLVANH